MIKLDKFVHEQQYQSVNTKTLAANRKRPGEDDILNIFDENHTNGIHNLYPLGINNSVLQMAIGNENGNGATSTVRDEEIASELENDNAEIAGAKTTIEGANYTTTHLVVKNIEEAKLEVERVIANLQLNGVTTEVIDGTFIPATGEGVNHKPGSYTFSVKLNKGVGTEIEVKNLILHIA